MNINHLANRVLDLEASRIRDSAIIESLHDTIIKLAACVKIDAVELERFYKERLKENYNNIYCVLEQENPELAGYLDRCGVGLKD